MLCLKKKKLGRIPGPELWEISHISTLKIIKFNYLLINSKRRNNCSESIHTNKPKANPISQVSMSGLLKRAHKL